MGGLDIKMSNVVLNELVYLSRSLINNFVNKQLSNVGTMIDSEIQKLNKMVQNEDQYTFVFPIYGQNLPLNLTMTHSPQADGSSDLVELFFDGLFDIQNSTFKFGDDITNYPPRLANAQNEQFWIHEDTFDSLVSVANAQLFPLTITDKSVTSQLLQVFFEFKDHYGQDVELALVVNYNQTSAKPVQFDKTDGILLGGEGNDLVLTVDILASNDKIKKEKAMSLELNAYATANISMTDLMIYPDITKVGVENVKKTFDKVNMYYHNYDLLF